MIYVCQIIMHTPETYTVLYANYISIKLEEKEYIQHMYMYFFFVCTIYIYGVYIYIYTHACAKYIYYMWQQN